MNTEETQEDQHPRQSQELIDADPGCDHNIQDMWSGIKCITCGGWFCYGIILLLLFSTGCSTTRPCQDVCCPFDYKKHK